MKKLLLIAAIIAALIVPGSSWAAGSCTQTDVSAYTGGFTIIKFVCTGSADDGSIPDTALSAANLAILQGTHYLYQVVAYPTSGGTAPDAADVQILMRGQDLLGGKGANLIHATNTLDVLPYNTITTAYRFPAITETLTLKVSNQATPSANYTIELVCTR
jgi:hypothetical protein